MRERVAELAARRDRFAAEVDDLRTGLHEEIGWAPSGLRWIVPLVALAVGVVAGVALRRNLPRLRETQPQQRRRR